MEFILLSALVPTDWSNRIRDQVRIPLKSATDSGVKAATESTRSLPPIPGESCRLSERSDAGVCLVTPRRR
jgi:hypothetical protein